MLVKDNLALLIKAYLGCDILSDWIREHSVFESMLVRGAGLWFPFLCYLSEFLIRGNPGTGKDEYALLFILLFRLVCWFLAGLGFVDKILARHLLTDSVL